MHSLNFYPNFLASRLSEGNGFVLSALLPSNSGIQAMSRRSLYLDRAKACADAAKRAHGIKECVELLQVSERFVLLAEHAARSERRGMSHRGDEERATLSIR
jgi:hypothetical protein